MCRSVYYCAKATLGNVSHGEAGFTAEVRGLTEALNVTKGRLFQYALRCNAGRCPLRREPGAGSLQSSGQCLAVEDNRRLMASGLGFFAAEFFQHGTLTWTTGSNTGRKAEVKAHVKSASEVMVELWHEAAYPVASGDAFDIRAGCDKQFSTCRSKFANSINFRGFPHIPGTDFVTSFPNRSDGGNDGGSRS